MLVNPAFMVVMCKQKILGLHVTRCMTQWSQAMHELLLRYSTAALELKTIPAHLRLSRQIYCGKDTR